MLGRPHSVERNVAAYLTQVSATLGYTPIERIPVLGQGVPTAQPTNSAW
jgi:hypothetical protein